MKNKVEYVEFIHVYVYANKRWINVLVDNFNEPLVDWIEDEDAPNKDTKSEDSVKGVDPIMFDDLLVDHD